MTIKKKRKVLRRKDRDLRIELLLTSTIRHLCQQIGDHLRSRRNQNLKRKNSDEDDDRASTATVSNHEIKRTRLLVEDDKTLRREEKEEEVGLVHMSDSIRESPSVNSIGPLVLAEEQISEDHSNRSDQSRKRKSDDIGIETTTDSKESLNEKDPFGLDEFFRSLRTCRVGGSKR